MNLSRRRLLSIMVAAAILATLAATTATSAFAKKPGGDGKKSNTHFKVTMEVWTWDAWPWWLAGPFKASGAIKDRGFAIHKTGVDETEIELQGEKGTIYVLLVDIVWTGRRLESHMDARFVILSGTGDYEGLQGEGSASGDYWLGEMSTKGELCLEGSVTSP